MIKKTVCLLTILFMALVVVNGQSGSPVAGDIKLLLAAAETNFANQVGELLMEDAEAKQVYYQSKKTIDGAKTVVVKAGTGTSAKYEYGIVYDLRPAGAIDNFIPVLTAYTETLAAMEKSGNYALEANNSGSVKTLFDKTGKKLMSVSWDMQFAHIYFYGR